MLTPEELPHYTYADYVSWEGKWELIEGIPYAMTPSPNIQHQRISQAIARLLDEALDDCTRCKAILPVDWKVAENTVVQPDNLVVCYRPSGTFLTKAPSLIFEILSPATAEKDRRTKYAIYEREGVSYYCIVDPEDSTAKIYHLHDGKYVKQLDATGELFDFVLDECLIRFDFSRIWVD